MLGWCSPGFDPVAKTIVAAAHSTTWLATWKEQRQTLFAVLAHITNLFGGVVLCLTMSGFDVTFRSLGTTPISGKTLLECKGHSRSSGSVPGCPRSSSRSSENDSGNAKSILGMASHDLCNAKTTIPGIDGNPHERFHLPMHSRSVFLNWGGPRAPTFPMVFMEPLKFNNRNHGSRTPQAAPIHEQPICVIVVVIHQEFALPICV